MWQDIKYGLRMLGKAPGFTAVAVVTLALGIGANTAIFSAVNGILLKRLPYAEPSQLVDLDAVKEFPGGLEGSTGFSADIWARMRPQIPSIAEMALWDRAVYTMTGEAAPEGVSAALVDSEFFPLLGVKPLMGRLILPGDAQPGAKRVAVISYALWRAHWGGSNAILNQTITLDDKAYTIVGVMPEGFDYPISTVQSDEGVWLPLIPVPGQKGIEADVYPIVRLKRGISLQAVNAQLKTVRPQILATTLDKELGGEWSGTYLRAYPLEKHFSDLNRALLILLGAVGFVLLIACVNVSALLLSRGWARSREVAIREALGASRVRIVRQFMTESVLLALAGGALGLLFSVWGVHVLRVVTPKNLPEHGHFDLNANILWFTIAVSLLTGILFGLAPAMQASSRRAGAAIRDGFESLAGTSARRSRRLRSVLVMVEVALAVILVIGATLVARSFEKLTSVKLGFRTDHILTMNANFSKSVCDAANEKKLEGCKAAVVDVLQRIREIPGVEDATVTTSTPLMPYELITDLKIEGRAHGVSLNSGEMVTERDVSTGYFQTLGIPLLSGRDFTDADTASSQRIAIVDETFAKKYLDGNALGRRISRSEDKKGNPVWMQIVGVAASVHDKDAESPLSGEIYMPYAQVSYGMRPSFVARTSENPAVMIPALRRAVWSMDKEAPITDVLTMDQVVSGSMADHRFQTMLLGSFGALGLILAMVGIYGVISYGVTQRTREIGVRMALGAQPEDVLRMVIREGMLLAGAGIAAGICGALALTRFLQSLLFEIKPTDPTTFAGVAVLLVMVALAACWIPARRAMRVEPMEALRYE